MWWQSGVHLFGRQDARNNCQNWNNEKICAKPLNSPNSLSTLRGSYTVSVKAGAWSVCSSWSACKCSREMALPQCWSASRPRAGSHKVYVAIVSPGIFPENSGPKGFCELSKCILTAQARTKCGSRSWAPAFFMRILAQNGFCEMPRCISTVQAQVWVTIVGPDNFHVNSRANGFCEMSRCISTAQARTKCGPRSWSVAFYL